MKKTTLLLLGVCIAWMALAQQPGFVSAFTIGGPNGDRVDHAVYKHGKLYIAGSFDDSIDLDPGSGTAWLVGNGRRDVFVGVYSSDSVFEMGFSIGGSNSDAGPSVDVDANGNIYLAGIFNHSSFDFDPSSGIVNKPIGQFTQLAYLAKYSPSGALVWVNSYNSSTSYFRDISINQKDLIAVVGTFQDSVDLNGGQGAPNYLYGQVQEALFYTCDTNGLYRNHFAIYGGAGVSGEEVVIDSQDSIIVAGKLNRDTADFKPGADTFYLSGNSTDFFVAKYSSDLTQLGWAFNIGGNTREDVYDLAVNPNDSILVCGKFTDTVDFDPGTGVFLLNGHPSRDDAYAVMYGPDGSFVLAESWGTSSDDRAYGVGYDNNGALLATGNLMNNGYSVKGESGGRAWTMDQQKGSGDIIGQRILNKGDGTFYILMNFEGAFTPLNDPAQKLLKEYGRFDIAILRYGTPINPATHFLEYPSVEVYPNPVSSQLTVTTSLKGEKFLSLRDVNGRLVFKQVYSNSNLQLNLGYLDAGMYILELSAVGRQHREKILIRD